MLKFPDHYGEANLDHNDHLSCYQSVAEEISTALFKTYTDENWISVEERQKAIETNELWTFRWYEKESNKCSFRYANTLDALMKSFNLDWSEVKFPDHKASLHLIHNAHLANNESITELLQSQPEYYSDNDWLSTEEKEKAINTNQLWTIHWYPDTPLGFCLRHAATLAALIASFEQ